MLHLISTLCWFQVPGFVNVDFADVRAIMADAGSPLMGIGTATGNLITNFYTSFSNLQF